ncbi:MAG: ATP-binding protein, partial [Candidatus Woesebacteria bacterium]|nr:ATP-binding protein [Candidatus Woesebacteria bacterium]
MKYISRLSEKNIIKASKTFKIVFLGGPRQVGKTTLLKKLSEKENRTYVTLDNLNQRELAKKEPKLFIDQLKLPAIIDEVQYAPELFSVIKEIVDRSDKNGQFWITGSQQFNLIKNIQESLAGRVAILDLLGLSQKEKPKLKSIFEEIFEGGFPIFQSKDKPDRNTFFNSYIQTYLDRDLSGIFGVSKLSEFNRFIQVCAARTAQVLNISDMARDSDIPVSTAVEWLSILEATKQIFLLRPYFPNITKRIIKSPKLYFVDTGLASYLTKWESPDNLKAGAMSGALFETYVVVEVIKKFINKNKEPFIFYLRDKEGHEVDLVVEENGLHLIEIKLSASVKS